VESGAAPRSPKRIIWSDQDLRWAADTPGSLVNVMMLIRIRSDEMFPRIPNVGWHGAVAGFDSREHIACQVHVQNTIGLVLNCSLEDVPRKASTKQPRTWGLTMSLASPSCVQELQTASQGTGNRAKPNRTEATTRKLHQQPPGG